MFITLYTVVLTFETVSEILKCDHSNESYWAVLSCGTLYYPIQGVSNFWVCGLNPKVCMPDFSRDSDRSMLSGDEVYYAVPSASGFETLDEILKSDHSN